jgi:hypothetical protein
MQRWPVAYAYRDTRTLPGMEAAVHPPLVVVISGKVLLYVRVPRVPSTQSMHSLIELWPILLSFRDVRLPLGSRWAACRV